MLAAFVDASASLFEKKLPDRGVPTRTTVQDRSETSQRVEQPPTEQLRKSFPILIHDRRDDIAPTHPEFRSSFEKAGIIEDLQYHRLP